jgi:hypothetical protein
MSGSFDVHLNFSGKVVLEKKIFKWYQLYLHSCGLLSLWLIDYLRFYVPLKNISLIWRRHHCRWRAAKFRPMLGAQGLWAGRDLYRATPAVTRDLGFSGLIQRTASFSRLLRHAWGCGGPILTRILTGSYPFEEDLPLLKKNKLEFPLCEDDLYQDWWKLVWWFCRRFLRHFLI